MISSFLQTSESFLAMAQGVEIEAEPGRFPKLVRKSWDLGKPRQLELLELSIREERSTQRNNPRVLQRPHPPTQVLPGYASEETTQHWKKNQMVRNSSQLPPDWGRCLLPLARLHLSCLSSFYFLTKHFHLLCFPTLVPFPTPSLVTGNRSDGFVWISHLLSLLLLLNIC